jgi:hypothetical protein
MKIYVKKHADCNYQKIPTKPEKEDFLLGIFAFLWFKN